MGMTLKEIMTPDPTTLGADQPVIDAAKAMREKHMGSVLVEEKGKLCGIVTDRDVVVRCVAEGSDPRQTRLKSLCSKELTTLAPDAAPQEAVTLMRKKAIRRLPVVDGEKPVGIVSLGDLAMAIDRDSALGQISNAKANL